MSHRRQSTTPSLPLSTLDGRSFGRPGDEFEENLEGKWIPQADDYTRIIALVKRIEQGLSVDAEGLGIAPRQVDYYTQAAQILGLVSAKNRLLAAGRALLSLQDDPTRRARLALAFENSRCGRAWTKWFGVTSLAEVNPKSATEFITARTDLGGATVGRRASTLETWMDAWMYFHPAVQKDRDPAQARKAHALGHTAVLDSGQSRLVVQALGPGTSLLRCATAYLSVGGYELLVEPLREAELRLLVGSDSAFTSVSQIITDFRRSITEGVPTLDKKEAIQDLQRGVVTGRVKVRIFDPRYKPRLHAKIYIFDEYAAYVASANLSKSGLQTNIEGGFSVREPDAIAYYRNQFDSLFQKGVELTQEVLRELEESWAFAPLTTPYLLYLRVLIELFPGVPELTRETQRRLADYQELTVGAVLRALVEQRGALLISPTGTGKTVMACYAAKVLFLRRDVQRIIVICPNARLHRMWEEEFHRFGLPVKVVTHGIVQGKGAPAEGHATRLGRIHGGARETDLVIVDECHAFRNVRTNGFENLNSLLDRREGPGVPRLLLLSATPMSRGLDDLNALLQLVSEPPLEKIEDLVSARRVVNITLPFIIKRFGIKKSGHSGGGLRFGNEVRYFGRIQVRTLSYQSPAEQVFDLISKMDFRFRWLPDEMEELRAAGDVAFPQGEIVESAAFLKLLLLRRAESSPGAIRQTIDRLLASDESRLAPESREELNANLRELRRLTQSTVNDTKLTELVRVLKERVGRRRVLVFSLWTDTVEYLVSALSRELPGAKIEALTGRLNTKERGRLIRRFAPSAQGRSRRVRHDDIDVLVATDAIAEGENLQDADVVVNYDLPWTPLCLIQRVGRVDRPTKKLRDIEVLNFYPENELFEQLLQLRRRLEDRSRMYEKMSRTQVVGETERNLAHVDENDIGLICEFYKSAVDFERIREKCTRVPTSAYLLDRAGASKRDVTRASSLPIGVCSCRSGPRPGIFALLRMGTELRCVFWPADGGPPEESPGNQAHDLLLEYVRVSPETAQLDEPSTFRQELEALVQQWAENHRPKGDEVSVVCAESIVPKRTDMP
ncbi:hypothetical protein D187_010464 [Cystobacter fuscus DSM 2262]|uniref:Uncharacterized protein n=1 Tax=Cystobacter fuscus (strain ATCC 25194 / DSM 2262 / NBRC 100088 / M29) TaxID=1242864 RepID=S9PBQ4_CYSF2|nr:helicase-related protein [Cystobacter fuscus]EPX61845.1 hypothetical protein D187_010464 [Cystobacter fuscus DSM 2262]